MKIDKLNNDIELDIDFSNLKLIFKKYAGLILASTLAASSIGYLRAKKMPKIWQGQFQIVLGNNSKGGSSNDIESSLKSLLGKKNSGTDLNTQLEIMKSPMVLVPAYENILQSEKFKALNIEPVSYGEILSGLTSKFKDGTTVLNITYDSTKKDLIPIVLDEISRTYQIFSYRDTDSSIEKGMKYLNKQIFVYDKKLSLSTSKLKEYSKKHDLSFEYSGERINISSERSRLRAAEGIRSINKRLNLLQSTDNQEEFVYMAKIFNPTSDILDKIKDIEKKIIVNQSLYKDDDELLSLLRNRKNDLNIRLRLDLIAFLMAEKKALKAEEISSNRPIEVLTEYARLIRENVRNQKYVKRFETNKNELILELAKSKEPWEIITEPKVLDGPIGPDRKKVLFIHAFFGFFGSLILFLILEIRKGKVLTSSECEKNLEIPSLLELSSVKNDQYWEESLKLLFNSYLNFEDKQKIAIYFNGDKNNELFQKFSSKLDNVFENKYFFTNNLLEVKDNHKQIIIIILGTNNFSELKDLRSKIKLQRQETLGFITLNNVNV